MKNPPVGETKKGIDFQGLSVSDVLAKLDVKPEVGLAPASVIDRRKADGPNEVLGEPKHPWRLFFSKFWGLSAWMLELIMVLSAVLGKIPDLLVISALLIINTLLGFIQEQRAGGVVDALQKRLQVTARALREGKWGPLPARELVPGDIVRVRSGDITPADIKLLAGQLTIDQSALTGESANADKGVGDVLPSGSIVKRGEGTGVVVLTGANTYYGRTTVLVQKARPKMHIEEVVGKVVRSLFYIVGILVLIVAVLSMMRGVSMIEMLPLLLVLLMSAVPLALPVMFTVTTALGSKELARKGVLVTRLSAAEDAATMDVLCVDKTGTITKNELAITSVVGLGNHTESEVLIAGAQASEAANQDPIDLAFLAEAEKRKLLSQDTGYKTLQFIPFDAKTRRTEARVQSNGKEFVVMKGAVQTIAEQCHVDAKVLEGLNAKVKESADKGYRMLAVAQGPSEDYLEFLGMVSLIDPLRPDAKQLIDKIRALGISVKMLTGDALAVAVEIATEVGLPNVERMADVRAAANGKTKKQDLFAGADGFAEVFPEDKYLVVQSLQAAGHVTGMTGDGVNDAPALRQAEVGIAVSSATDVAKGAASVVLIDPGLTNIVSLVQEGRTIYQRILTWIINKVSRTILKAGFVSIAFIVTGKFVVSAFAMLLLVFMTDFAKIALATDNVRPSKRPETWNISGLVLVSSILGVAMICESLGFLWFAWRSFGLDHDDNALFTFSFLTMLYFAAFSVLSARERRWFGSSVPSLALVLALVVDVVTGTALTYVGIPGLRALVWWQPLVILGVAAAACLVMNDVLKVWLIRWRVPDSAT